MANDGKQPGTNFASGGVVMAALVAAGTGYFVSHKAPLQGSRPAMIELQFHQSATSQDIEARLWQDPFAAVAKTIEKAEPGKSESCGANSGNAPPAQPTSHCISPLAKVGNAMLEKTLVVAVTMPGAPYVEDGEVRRRTRYAISSSLERASFVPEDEHHIGYFRPQDPTHQLPDLVPYEWFVRSTADQQQTSRVLVLWINEDALRGNPLWKLARLVTVPHENKTDLKRDVPIRIVGPYSSDIILDMAKEAGPGTMPCMSPPNPPAEEWRGHIKSMSFYHMEPLVENCSGKFTIVTRHRTPRSTIFSRIGVSPYTERLRRMMCWRAASSRS